MVFCDILWCYGSYLMQIFKKKQMSFRTWYNTSKYLDKKNARTRYFAVQNAGSLFFAPFETLLPFCELVSSRRAVVWSFNTLSAIYSVMILIWTITFICVLFDLAPVMISREQVSKRWKLSTHVQIYIDHQISFILMLPRGYVLVPKSYIY